MSDVTDPGAAPAPPPSAAPGKTRRWPRRVAAGAAVLVLAAGGAAWLLGRESTLQQLVQRVASASGGQIAVTGVSGSLYHRMHIGHLVYKGKDSIVTADNIDIDWSPLQYFSEGLAISALHVASLDVNSTAPSQPATMPASLAAPFRLSLADARLDRLTLRNTGVPAAPGAPVPVDVIEQLRFALSGDGAAWHLERARAQTAIGRVDADLTIAVNKPFALQGRASLTQTATTAKPAQLALQARGSLALLNLSARGTAGAASADALLTLAPFDPVMLRAIDLKGRGIDPSGVNAAWPKADLSLDLDAQLGTAQQLSGRLALVNQGRAGPLDRNGVPLQALRATLGGTLTATTLRDVLIDLGPAGKFTGGGDIARSGPEAGIDHARFTLHTDRIDLQGIGSTLHPTAIAGDIAVTSTGTAPGGKQAITAALAQAGLRLDLQATLIDAVLHVEQARLLARKGSVSATGQASLKGEQPFSAKVNIEHFDPSGFGAYPAADLNAVANASGHAAPQWQLATDFTIKPSKLFGQPLSGAGKLAADARHVGGVDARLALGQNTAEIKGGFGAPGEQLRWSVDARQLSAASADLLGALTASGVVSGSLAEPRTSFTVDARALGLASARHPVADSALHASGEAWLAAGKTAATIPSVKLGGSAQRINPVAFGAYPAGSINGTFSANAALGADWRAGVELLLQPSTLSGAPLSGHATLAGAPKRIDNADVELRLGANSLLARGGFGAARDRLDWKLDAPQLASLGPQFAGVLHAAGTLSGTAEKPALALALDGANLRAPGQQQVTSLKGSATLGAVGASAPVSGNDVPLVADIEIAGYASQAFTLNTLRLQAGGNRNAHTLQLNASNSDFDATLRVKGGWNSDTWNGAIDALQNRGRYALSLQAPAPLRIGAPAGAGVGGLLHPEQVALGAATIRLADGAIRIDQLQKNGAQWSSKGLATGVPVNYLAQMSDAWRDNVRSDMTLGAAWALNLQAASISAGGAPAIDGMLHLYREAGDVTMTGADVPLPLGLRQLDARVDVAANTLRMQLALDGSRAGQAKIDASAQLQNGRLAGDSALTLAGNANMGSLAWLAPLTGQPGLELDGTLKLAVTGGGSIAAPQLNGDVSGDRLVLNWADQGVKLRNGQLQAHLAGDQLQLQKLTFDGAEGRAQADGWIRFANAEATMQLKLTADKLEVLGRPDRTLVVSGQSTLTRDARHFQLDGKFRADRASIELAGENTPTLSDDVVVLGKGVAPAPSRAAQSMPLNIDVEADLGDAFYLTGKGLDAQLAGAVRIRVADRRPPRANGNIRVVSGTYAAYGQKLDIERGVISFTGAYDNPGLNILAVRKRPEGEALSETNVEAGVEVRGTALAPVAKLVSTPTVSDSDKLAWLVLGHGIDSAAGNDMALLGTAAGALFGGGQGKLAGKLGLDELGVGQASGTGSTTGTGQASGLQNTVVTVGKRISSRAYLSFEQGASTATSLVKLRYKLNPKITLQFQTGTNNALDVLYTWAFD